MSETNNNVEPIQQLMKIIRKKVDPDGTLPLVTLSRDTSKILPIGDIVSYEMHIINNMNNIGCVTVVRNKIEGTACLSNIQLDSGYLDRGFGFATYIAAIENVAIDGLTLQTDENSQTERVKHIWELLAGRGVATVTEPFIPIGVGIYKGEYKIKNLKDLTE